MDEGVVSKETVVLRRWGSSLQKFGFINGVGNVNGFGFKLTKGKRSKRQLLESAYGAMFSYIEFPRASGHAQTYDPRLW